MLGRIAELEQLNRYYEQTESKLVVVYSQPGVGLDTFLSEFVKDKNVHTFVSRGGSERQQLYLWSQEMKNQGIVIEPYPDFSVLFSKFISSSGKQVLWIHEFQNLVKCGPSFMDALTDYYHNRWNQCKTLIILSSTSIGWIENMFVSKIGKTAFEISGFLKLRPQCFVDIVCYFERWSTKECVEAYGILGGNIKYWNWFDKNRSIKDNICEQILSVNSPFIYEGNKYLFTELREDTVYNTILSALAEGRNKLNSLYQHTGYSRAKISVYIKNLMQLEIVEKVYSYDTGGFKNAQKGVYRICHPFLHFYYRYIYKNYSDFSRISAEEFYNNYIKNDLKHFYGEAFKSVCLEFLSIMNDKQMLPIHYRKCGEWVGKVGTIDIVAQDEHRNTICCLCNWEKEVFALDDYEWFLYCLKEARLKPDFVYLFSAGSFSNELIEKIGERNNKEIFMIDIKQL